MGFLDKFDDVKIKLKQLVVIKKKLKALQNYACCGTFEHQDFLLLIEKCLSHPRAGEVECQFLDQLLERYNIDYLSWSHRTQALKKEMVQVRKERIKTPPIVQEYLFDMNSVTASSYKQKAM